MNIENYFESDEFLKSLKPMEKYFNNNPSDSFRIVEYFISIAIKYSILFKSDGKLSTAGLSNFLKKVAIKAASIDLTSIFSISSNSELEKYISQLYIDELLLKLDLDRENLNDENCKKTISTYIIKKLKGNIYKYHAFNSAFLDSILANGINPNINFTPQDDINSINEIFEKKGIKMAFGWQKLNCNGLVSYSKTPSVSYYYGTNSPEWFAQFTGQGFRFNPPDKYVKDAYVEGNYDAAKNNLLTLMKEYNFSSEDQESVINFFDKNWNIYANKTPMLAIIPDTQKDSSEYWINALLTDPYYADDTEKIMHFCMVDYEIDCQSEETIDISNAIFVKLPKYYELLRKLSSKNNEVTQNENIKSEDELLFDKLMNLINAKIKVKIGTTGPDGWVSEHGEEEIIKVKEILKDNEVFQAIVKNKFGKEILLDGWIKYFDRKILDNPENIKLLAVNKPTFFHCVSEENRNNIELMRECASQEGVHPILTCYVGTRVQNDFTFICNLIMNSNENTFDFYSNKGQNMNISNLRYYKSIGSNIRSNPIFWELLNSKIISINENTSRKILLFSPQKELDLVRTHSDLTNEENVENCMEDDNKPLL